MWCSNHLCEAKVLQHKQYIHAQKLATMKASIDMRDPRRPKTANSKGARLVEERNARINNENTILLNKLSKILTREGGSQARPLPAVNGSRTLHDGWRRREREKIDRENAQLLTRLQSMKPSINVVAFERDWYQQALFAERSRMLHGPGTLDTAREPRRSRPTSSARPRTVPAGGRRIGSGRAHEIPHTYFEPLLGGATAAPAPAAESAGDATDGA